MTRIPVYQMTFGQDEQGRAGLVFSNEQEAFESRSILYAIPILHRYHDAFELFHDLEHQSIYFPFEMDGEYYELIANVRFPEFRFSIPGTEIEIVFEAEYEPYWPGYFFPFTRRFGRQFKYVGKETEIVPPNEGFMTLLPVDLFELDDLYLSRKAIFVGRTPTFGSDGAGRSDVIYV